jgi:thiamine-phosphate diphosphorylase
MIAALDAGVRFFQYRNKNKSRRDIYEICAKLSGLSRKAGALFLVNDHADIALAVEADGVHLGQDDLPIDKARKLLGRQKIIGISTHDREQAWAAEQAGAEYIGFGPIFTTPTKDAGRAQGLDGIRQIKQVVSLPVIAIGGINHSNAGDVLRAGADGIAVISAVLSAPDFKAAAAEMVRLVKTGKKA